MKNGLHSVIYVLYNINIGYRVHKHTNNWYRSITRGDLRHFNVQMQESPADRDGGYFRV